MGKNDRRVRQLAGECANFLGEGNRCLVRVDRKCVFFGEPQQELATCRYFESCVLPLDVELQVGYLAERRAAAAGYALSPFQEELARESVASTANRRGRRAR